MSMTEEERQIYRDALFEFIVRRGGVECLGVDAPAKEHVEAGVFKYVAERYAHMDEKFKARKFNETCLRVLQAKKLLTEV
jgi:hypothetical protein